MSNSLLYTHKEFFHLSIERKAVQHFYNPVRILKGFLLCLLSSFAIVQSDALTILGLLIMTYFFFFSLETLGIFFSSPGF